MADCDGVGGIGLKVSKKQIVDMYNVATNSKAVVSDNNDYLDMIEGTGLNCADAGNYFSGEVTYYALISATHIREIPKAIEVFIEDTGRLGLVVTEDDINIISDSLVS